MISEHQVLQSWRQLFQNEELSETTLLRADELVEQLRPESPLRHRLGQELEDIRAVRASAGDKDKTKKRTPAKRGVRR